MYIYLLHVWSTLCFPTLSSGCISYTQLWVYFKRNSAFSVCGKSECSFGNTGNLPEGLFARSTFNFSVFTRVMLSLSGIYYKYWSCYLISAFLCMTYAVIEWIWKIFATIWLFTSKTDCAEFVFSLTAPMGSSVDHTSTYPECGVLWHTVKPSMARSLPVENLLPQKVGSIINYFQ